MKTLTVRGLPEDVHAGLKRRAKDNRRSLNQEVIAGLIEMAGQTKRAQRKMVEDLLAEADAVYTGVQEPLTGSEIREAIEDGRN